MTASEALARRLRRLGWAAMVFAMVWPIARLAAGDPSSNDVALADALFRDGRALMDRAKFSEACPKLQESHRLDPGGGVVLALALCREAEGKTASALLAFEEARIFAERDQRADRKATIEEHLTRLRPLLAHLSILASEGARIQAVVITLDGRALANAAVGASFPVDPGEHRVLATAMGKAPYRTSITVAAGSDVHLVMPPLLDAQAIDGGELRTVGAGGLGRTLGWVSIGLGALSLGVSGFYALRAHSREHDSEPLCLGDVCDREGAALRDRSKDETRVAVVALGVGAAAMVLGVILVLSDGSAHVEAKKQAGITLRIAPMIGSTRGLALGGAF